MEISCLQCALYGKLRCQLRNDLCRWTSSLAIVEKTFYRPVLTRYLLITTAKWISKPLVKREAHFTGSIELLWLKGQGIITLAYLEGTWLHNSCNNKNVNCYSIGYFHLPFFFLVSLRLKAKTEGDVSLSRVILGSLFQEIPGLSIHLQACKGFIQFFWMSTQSYF